MKSVSFSFAPVQNRRRGGAFRLICLAAASCTLPLAAQTAAISQTEIFLGGNVAFDRYGNVYGWTTGPLTEGAYQTESGGGTCVAGGQLFGTPGPCPDAYAGKLDPLGRTFWGTRIGGPKTDRATAGTVDESGNVLVTGTTEGSFPITPRAAGASVTAPTAFVAKVSADGSKLLYATYLPASVQRPQAIAVDAQGNAYVAGTTADGGFVIKLDPAGESFLFERVLAGPARAVAIDSSGNVLVAGDTGPESLVDALDGYVEKLSASGAVIFTRTFGGSKLDRVRVLGTDSAGEIYIGGLTRSTDLPTAPNVLAPRPIVPLWNGYGPGGFLARLSPDGSTIRWTRYLMSTDGADGGVTQLKVADDGNLYVSGQTGAGFPVTATAPRPCFDGGASYNTAFLARLSKDGGLLDATYVGRWGTGVYGLNLLDGSVQLTTRIQGREFLAKLTFGGAPAAACLSPSVLNAASFSGEYVSPSELISLTGLGIGPETGMGAEWNAQGELPRLLGGVEVLFDGIPAPLLYVQSRQINAIAPSGLRPTVSTDVVFTTISVRYNGSVVGSVTLPVHFATPGFFRREPGYSPQAAAINQDGTVNGPDHPAPRGSVVSLFGTGFGNTDPACTPGGLNVPGPTGLTAAHRAALFDGRGVPVDYAGSAPGLACGVTQINFRVPEYAEPGPYLFRGTSERAPAAGGSTIYGIGTDVIYVK